MAATTREDIIKRARIACKSVNQRLYADEFDRLCESVADAITEAVEHEFDKPGLYINETGWWMRGENSRIIGRYPSDSKPLPTREGD